jgi:hypothetical protein
MMGCIILQGMQLTEPISTKVTLCSAFPGTLFEAVSDMEALLSALPEVGELSGCFDSPHPSMLPNTSNGAWHEHPPVERRNGTVTATAMAIRAGIINFIALFILILLLYSLLIQMIFHPLIG